ncbi:hypothetical protein, partial [Hoylesella timonensis]
LPFLLHASSVSTDAGGFFVFIGYREIRWCRVDSWERMQTAESYKKVNWRDCYEGGHTVRRLERVYGENS